MFSTSTYYTLAAQLARLVTTHPRRQRERAAPRPEGSGDGCGCCPACGEFVFVEFPDGVEPTPCPRCGVMIDSVGPLGGPAPDVW